MTVLSYLGAIGAAQREAMEADERVIIFGEDVEANVYGTTGGKSRAEKGDFLTLFGSDRIRNTPISEEVMVGTAAGAAMTGLRPIVDLSYSSFLYMAMDQFVNQVAKNRYMFGGQASLPVVFRSAMFYGLNTGAHHSECSLKRYVMTSTRLGPSPARARSAASVTASNTVRTFCPSSTRTPGMSKPWGRYCNVSSTPKADQSRRRSTTLSLACRWIRSARPVNVC